MQKLQTVLLPVAACVFLLAARSAVSADDQTVPVTQSVFRPVLNPDPAAEPGEQKLVKVGVFPRYDKLPRGEKCPVAVELTVKDGWHINANPAKPKFQIPTEVKLKTRQKIKLTKVAFPKHKLHSMQGETEQYHVYDGKVMIYVLLEIDPQETADMAALEFHVRYQACNDDQCIKPVTEKVGGKMMIADPGSDIKKTHDDKFPKVKDKPQQ